MKTIYCLCSLEFLQKRGFQQISMYIYLLKIMLLDLLHNGIFFPVHQVFKNLDFLGWYTTGSLPTENDIRVHKQVNFFLILK